jgi:hypothetical protein
LWEGPDPTGLDLLGRAVVVFVLDLPPSFQKFSRKNFARLDTTSFSSKRQESRCRQGLSQRVTGRIYFRISESDARL